MPGPYYSNRDEDLVLAGTEQTAPREYPVWGHPPMGGTLLSEGSVFDSLPMRMALEHGRALEYALTGAENNGTVEEPSEGHRHDEGFDAAMPWCQIESYRCTTMQHAPSVTHVGWSYIVDSTSFVDVLFVPLIVRDGITHVVPRFWVAFAAGAGNRLTLQVDFYAPSNLNAVAVSGGSITKAAESFVFDSYIEMDARGIDVSGIAKSGDVRLVVMRVQAKVNSGVAGIRQVQLMGSDQGYVAFPSRAPLDTTMAQASGVYLSADYLKTLFVDSPSRLRTLTFGNTFTLPTRSRAHDHGEARGEHLRRHLLSASFGPHVLDGTGATSGGTLGVPLSPPTGGFDFTITPKLIARLPLFVPGTYSQLSIQAVVHLAGVEAFPTVSLICEVRPIREDFATYGAGSGVTCDFNLAAGTNEFVFDGSTLDLTPLGGVGFDRMYELVVWQISNPEATEDYRLCGLVVYESDDATEATLEEDVHYPPSEELTIAEIRQYTEVTDVLTAQMARVQNQLCMEVLGGIPGWTKTQATNTEKAWRRLIRERHQHRGTFTNSAGDIIDDGALIRMPLFTQSYLTNLNGSGVEGSTFGGDPPLGHKIHTNASLSSSVWPEFEAWVTLPQGCTAIELYGLIQPGTSDPSGRLYCVVLVTSHDAFDDDSTIASYVTAEGIEATDNASTRMLATSFQCTEVLPQKSAAWTSNGPRLRRGLGCWTTDALRRSALNSGKLRTNPARWTEPIRVALAPTYSGSHLLRVQWALQVGDRQPVDDGTYTTSARLLAMMALPARIQ